MTDGPASDGASAPAENRFEMVVGLEVHVQLKTRTKAFCACSTSFGDHMPGAWRARRYGTRRVCN